MLRSTLPALAALTLWVTGCGAAQSPQVEIQSDGATAETPVPQTWSTVVSSTAPFESAPASVGIIAPDGMEFTEGFPYRLTVRSTSDPDFGPVVLEARDATQRDAQNVAFRVQCPASELGTHEYVATFSYSLCTATSCIPGEIDVSWTITVR